MELVKKNETHSIFKKRSGRYCVQDPKGQTLHGEEKIKVLVDAKLVKLQKAKPKAEPKAEAAPAEAPKA
jgi:hypothetical protein